MAQVMYVQPTGEPGQARGFAMPKKLSLRTIYRAAQKTLAKDLSGHFEPELPPEQPVVSDRIIVFHMRKGGQIVIDRRANGLGR